MRVFGRHCTFRRHSGVAERVRAGSMPEVEAPCDRVRQTDILEHLDALAKSENAEFGMTMGEPVKEFLLAGAQSEDRVAAIMPRRFGERKGSAEFGFERPPIVLVIGRVQCHPERPCRRWVAIESKASAVRPAFGHLRQHAGQQRPEGRRCCAALEEQPDNPAHPCIPEARTRQTISQRSARQPLLRSPGTPRWPSAAAGCPWFRGRAASRGC